MKAKFRYFLLVVVLGTKALITSELHAQNGVFDDLILKGGTNGQPFIRFDQTDPDSDFIAAFNDWMGFYVGDAYQFRIFQSAPSNALILDNMGATIKDRLRIQHVNNTAFTLRSLDESTGLNGGGIGFLTHSNLYPFWVFDDAKEETLAVQEMGVGVGTYFPTDALHVYADGFPFSKAKVVVENDIAGAPVPRNMFSLINNGATRFSFTDTSINSSWVFASVPSGAFSISKDGTGGSEFLIQSNGRVKIGPGGNAALDLLPNGNLTIAGTLTQSSDKNLKTAFADVDDAEVLDRVEKMPVQTWQFKFDDPELRHMGPTAQDFHAAFGLGKDEHTIAPVDGIGVSLAAIKALKQEVDEKDERLKRQEELLEKLSERIDELESKLAGQR